MNSLLVTFFLCFNLMISLITNITFYYLNYFSFSLFFLSFSHCLPLPPSTPPTPQTQARHSTPLTFPIGPSQLHPRRTLLMPTFPTGQISRWENTAPLQYTDVVGPHLISLKHLQNGDISYYLHSSSHLDNTEKALLDFLNATISLVDLWQTFSAFDASAPLKRCSSPSTRPFRVFDSVPVFFQ